MPREAGLFEEADGSVVRAYLMLKQSGGNIPPAWIERSCASRRGRHKAVASALKKGRVTDILVLEDWETRYKKEHFYRGIRALMELERKGRTRL